MSSYSVSASETFTDTHARHLAAKVATDLKRVQRFYPTGPSDTWIASYEAEIVALLKAGYLDTVTYGFQRYGRWIAPTLRYTASDLASGVDDDPGRIRPGADVSGAVFTSYLTRSAKWHLLSSADQAAFDKGLPFSRVGAAEPGVSGYFVSDRGYSAGGRSLDRSSVVSL